MSSTILIWIVTVLYAGQVVVSSWNGQYPQAMMVGGYAMANIGLIWSMMNIR